VYLHVVGVFF